MRYRAPLALLEPHYLVASSNKRYQTEVSVNLRTYVPDMKAILQLYTNKFILVTVDIRNLDDILFYICTLSCTFVETVELT